MSAPKKTKKDGKIPPFLSPDLAKFAKQLGVDITGLEPEAQHVWNHLEKLSVENPIEYERFVADQMAAAKKGASDDSKGRSFRPNSEFVIETKSTDGDGSIVRELHDRNVEGKALFVNICSSELIEPPKDKAGKPIDSSRTIADGLEIPLLIGPIRPINDQSNAIDVIFHPIVPKICREERYFRGQILDLAQDWILQETTLKFKKNSYEDMEGVKYKGGLGDQGDIPVLFMIDDAMLQNETSSASSSSTSAATAADGKPTHPTKSSASNNLPIPPVSNSSSSTAKSNKATGKSDNVLSSTSSLLKEIHRNKDQSTIEEMKTLSTSTTSTTQKKTGVQNQKATTGPIIQEIGKDKGALPNSVASLDDSKSTKTASSSQTTTAKAEQPLSSTTTSATEKKYQEPSKLERASYQDLLDQFENPEAYNPLENNMEDDPETALIKNLAKVLTPETVPGLAHHLQNTTVTQPSSEKPSKDSDETNVPASSVVAATPKDTLPALTLFNSHPEIALVAYSINAELHQVVVEIKGLKGTASMNSLVLESSRQEILIQSQLAIFEAVPPRANEEVLKVELKFLNAHHSIQKDQVKAAWKKKVKTLFITIPFSSSS